MPLKQPLWRWAGWLSLGLSGCLHGDIRPTTLKVESRDRDHSRQVLPVSAKRAYARLLATRGGAIQVVSHETASPTTESSNTDDAATFQVAIPGPGMSSHKASAETCESCVREECALPRAAQGVAAKFIPEPVPPAEPLPKAETVTPNMTITPYRPPSIESVAEPRRFEPAATAAPIASSHSPAPSKTERSGAKPSLDEDFFPEDQISVVKTSVKQTANTTAPAPKTTNAPQKSAVSPSNSEKEVQDVTNELSAAADDVAPAQPRDVALLVDQVFEDLRQRRLADARQRTEWLKQLVARRAGPTEETSEPRRLEPTQPAAPIEPAEMEDFFDEDNSAGE